jgi:hypothetical protein
MGSIVRPMLRSCDWRGGNGWYAHASRIFGDKQNRKAYVIGFSSLQSRKMQDNGWKPRWFRRDDDTFRYVGGYWEARQQRKWDGCHDIFGEFV